MSEKKSVKILRGAKELIEKVGFHAGCYGDYGKGCCLVGACCAQDSVHPCSSKRYARKGTALEKALEALDAAALEQGAPRENWAHDRRVDEDERDWPGAIAEYFGYAKHCHDKEWALALIDRALELV